MLADDILAGVGGGADQLFDLGIAAFGRDIARAARYDLSPGVMLSAQAVHKSNQAARTRALSLCKLPFERTWFEWHGADPSGERPTVVGPDRYAPVPRRVGALVTVDETRQRGTMTWGWFINDPPRNVGVNMCPLAVTFDWREEPEPIDDLFDQALRRYAIPPAEAERLGTEHALALLPKLRGLSREELTKDRERFGFIWSPYVKEFAAVYERLNGPLEPGHELWDHSIGDITGEPGMLQCAIMLLNSRNLTSAEKVPAPDKLNRQRAKKGRLPLMDYTTIRIKLSRSLAQRAGAPGERSAARLHVVSGHFKVRKSGVYWWNDFTRGDPMQGVVRRQTRKVLE